MIGDIVFMVVIWVAGGVIIKGLCGILGKVFK